MRANFEAAKRALPKAAMEVDLGGTLGKLINACLQMAGNSDTEEPELEDSEDEISEEEESGEEGEEGEESSEKEGVFEQPSEMSPDGEGSDSKMSYNSSDNDGYR